MKKNLAVLISMLLVVTGCGDKKANDNLIKELTCTLDENGLITKTVVEFDENDKAKEINMTMNMIFEEELSKEETEYMESYMQLLCYSFDYDGVTCKTNSNSESMNVLINMDFTKMSKETMDELEFDSKKTSYADMKVSLEESGYICK